MRTTAKSKALVGRAIAGTYVVILAWDFRNPSQKKLDTLMGFSIHRAELKNGKVIEQYFLRGIKRFYYKDKGLAPGTPVSTADHPVQSFQWGDYTAKAGVNYVYTITPLYGSPKNLTEFADEALKLDITTEKESGFDGNASTEIQHDIYFNRGVIGSQAYAREFKNAEPDASDPLSPEMKWLSRGLFEALIGFINLAGDGYSLRASLYEFHYQPVANAFAKAIQAGADVKIIYDAESTYKVDNEHTIRTAGLDDANAVIPRTVSEGIRHNKFIVLLKGDEPIAVWTGSTNISPGGIFGHSNVGHVVWDRGVAQSFFEYWELLSQNLTATKMREPVNQISPLPKSKPKVGVKTIFSPRDAKDANDTLEWYAKCMAGAKQMVCFTVAFNIDEVFQEVLSAENDVLRYIVKDDDLGRDEVIGTDNDVIFAAGGYLGNQSLFNFLAERGNPLNRNDYIHTKFMLVDPLTDDPLVITGSANFSKPSQRINDENMLVIRGDKRVADIYFGEYMRIFDHHYARYLNRKFIREGTNNPNAGYLKEKPQEWVSSHFNESGYKAKRRKYFVGE